MGKDAARLRELFHEMIDYLREHHAEAIDKAYTYFWDGETPDEFLAGGALMLGFHNFEDWLVFDHKTNEEGVTCIDLFIKENKELDQHSADLLRTAKDSVMSLYEVTAAAKDQTVSLKDILLGGEAELTEKALTSNLKTGDLFATRIFRLDGEDIVSACVYPYNPAQKKKVLANIDRQFKRYIRNVNKEGSMRDYLKEYGDVFNLIWMSFIVEPSEKEEESPTS